MIEYHTKGKWRVIAETGYYEIRSHHQAYPLARVNDQVISSPEAKSNAFLMAAAPCLYEFLKHVIATQTCELCRNRLSRNGTAVCCRARNLFNQMARLRDNLP